jgi:uncharacterized protein GlcG (DUF336 family)
VALAGNYNLAVNVDITSSATQKVRQQMTDTIATISQVSPILLSLEKAQAVTTAGIAKATELGIPFTFTVLDGGGNVVLTTRMDGAALASIDTSQSKARTSVYFGAPTAALAGAVAPSAPMFSIETAANLPLAFVGGGVPITDAAGVVIGALGAGGGTPDQDHEVASTAIAAL